MAVKIRKPAKPIDYPPRVPAPRTSHTYFGGENWGSIAGRFSIPAVWDLIYYNFQCRNPEEVNWCMKEFFGCSHSKDGLNFSFDTSDRYRQVFIPPTWFQAPFGADDNAARELVLAALGHNAVDLMNFRLGSLSVNRGLFGDVKKHVLTHTITVHKLPDIFPARVLAMYSRRRNALLFRNPRDRSALRLGLAIHECVHAGHDIAGAGGTVADGEACAYVAEAVFALSFRTDLASFDPFAAGIPEVHRQWAAFIAKDAILHSFTGSSAPFTMPAAHAALVILKDQISRLAEYRATAADPVDNDGV